MQLAVGLATFIVPKREHLRNTEFRNARRLRKVPMDTIVIGLEAVGIIVRLH